LALSENIKISIFGRPKRCTPAQFLCTPSFQ